MVRDIIHTCVHLPAEGQRIAQELGCRFVETSAKLGINVTETFTDLVCEIRDRDRVRLNCFCYFLSFLSLSLSLSFLSFCEEWQFG